MFHLLHHDHDHDSKAAMDTKAAHGLGWAPLAIAATEMACPHHVERLLGLDHDTERQGIIRTLGLRELVHGLTILTEDRASKELSGSVWSRVLGDVLDTALLGVAAAKTREPGKFAAVAAGVMAI